MQGVEDGAPMGRAACKECVRMNAIHHGPHAIMHTKCHRCNQPLYLVGMDAYLAYRQGHPSFCSEHRQIDCLQHT